MNDTAFAEALVHHQAGRLDVAAAQYRAILTHEPNHSDSLHLLGLITAETADPHAGIALIRRAMALDPGCAPHHNSLGHAYRRLGHLEAFRGGGNGRCLRQRHRNACDRGLRAGVLESLARADGDLTMLTQIAALNAASAKALDSRHLEDWPRFFLDQCLYKVTTADNVEQGYQAGLIYADSRAMLEDRVMALREANIYERQRYRHILGMPLLGSETNGQIQAETSFLVVRTMRDGQMMVFAAGVYLDRVARDAAGDWRYAERIVVCDSQRIDTLLAIPL